MVDIKKDTARPMKEYNSVGGTDTYLMMRIDYNKKVVETVNNNNISDTNNFAKVVVKNEPAEMYIWLGSVISISYSVYRNKKAVHSLGHKVISGFASGPRYVAGTIIKTMFLEDDLILGLQQLRDKLKNASQYADHLAILNMASTPESNSNLMLDDILSCDIIVLYASEYQSNMIKEVITGATFINNGQVMSVNDMITETTISYIAQDVLQHDRLDSIISPLKQTNNSIIRASDLI